MPTKSDELAASRQFYVESMQMLSEHGMPFLVGGAYAMACYTGIKRNTKDLDLYIRFKDVDRILELFQQRGYRFERRYPHWLVKVFHGDDLIDLIYRAGNGLCEVDDSWLERGQKQEILGMSTFIAAPEELIWMKAYIMERERYDGADVAHLLLSCLDQIDLKHLIARFDQDWPVLLSHLLLFGYIYPSERHRLPKEVLEDLIDKIHAERSLPIPERLCRGTLLSRAQYLVDVRERGFSDARLEERSRIRTEELELWTARIPPQSKVQSVERCRPEAKRTAEGFRGNDVQGKGGKR